MRLTVLGLGYVGTVRDVPRRLRGSQSIVDLVRVSGERSVAGVYEGICW